MREKFSAAELKVAERIMQEAVTGLKKEGSSASTGMLDFLPSKCEGLRKAVETACAIITSDFL